MSRETIENYIIRMKYLMAIMQLAFLIIGILFGVQKINYNGTKDYVLKIIQLLMWGLPCLR